jgi:hypothetical protein
VGTVGALLSVGGMSSSDSDDALRIVPDILKIHDEDDERFVITYALFLVLAATKRDRISADDAQYGRGKQNSS